MSPIRLLLVEDQTILRKGLMRLLETYESLSVVAEAGSVSEAIATVKDFEFDVVLLDMKLPDGKGLEIMPVLSEHRPDAKVIVLSTYDEFPLVEHAINLGVKGYMPKNTDVDQLIAGIESVAKGGTSLHPDILSQLMQGMAQQKEDDADRLTERELKIVKGLAEGETTAEIAEVLYVSERTVRRYLDTIYAKLGVSDRAQAVAEAMRRGYVS